MERTGRREGDGGLKGELGAGVVGGLVGFGDEEEGGLEARLEVPFAIVQFKPLRCKFGGLNKSIGSQNIPCAGMFRFSAPRIHSAYFISSHASTSILPSFLNPFYIFGSCPFAR